MSKPQLKLVSIHQQDCACGDCRRIHARVRNRLRGAALSVSAQILIGFAAAHAAIALYDWLTDGPGPFVVFGL